MVQRVRGSKLPRNIHDSQGGVDAPALDENLREIERLLDEGQKLKADTPPGVELILDQVGDMLSMVVLVHDVGNNWEGYVRFKKLSGPGDFDITDPTDGSWTTDAVAPFAETVTLEEKHGGVIAVAVPYKNLAGELLWVVKSWRGDADHVANLVGYDVAFDTSGYPVINLTGDEDTRKHYLNGAVGADIAAATPADPSASSKDATLATRDGHVKLDGVSGTARQTQMGQMFGFKVVCENKDGDVNPKVYGPYFRRRGDSKTVPPRVNVLGTRSGSTVSVVLTVTDPSLAVTAVEFRRKNSGGTLDAAFGTGWTSSTGTPGTDRSLTRAIDVTSDPGLDARLLWRVTYTDEVGASQYIGDEIDVAHLEQVSKTIRFGQGTLGPAFDTNQWSKFLTHFEPGAVGSTLDLTGGLPVPRGVALTSISARMYRNAVGDQAECTFARVTDSGVDSVLATLTHSSTSWQTVSATLSESASDTATYDYSALVELTSTGAVDDARFRYIDLSYDAPSYDKSY